MANTTPGMHDGVSSLPSGEQSTHPQAYTNGLGTSNASTTESTHSDDRMKSVVEGQTPSPEPDRTEEASREILECRPSEGGVPSDPSSLGQETSQKHTEAVSETTRPVEASSQAGVSKEMITLNTPMSRVSESSSTLDTKAAMQTDDDDHSSSVPRRELPSAALGEPIEIDPQTQPKAKNKRLQDDNSIAFAGTVAKKPRIDVQNLSAESLTTVAGLDDGHENGKVSASSNTPDKEQTNLQAMSSVPGHSDQPMPFIEHRTDITAVNVNGSDATSSSHETPGAHPVSSTSDPTLTIHAKFTSTTLTSSSNKDSPMQINPSTLDQKSPDFSVEQSSLRESSSPSPSSNVLEPEKQVSSSSPSTLANNPYLGLSMAFAKSQTSPGSSGFNPYALYYGPGTPVTPHTPAYPHPYPYYYLPTPLPGPSMYPTTASPTFVPSPTTSTPTSQKTPISEVQKHRPKRLKAHAVTTGTYNIPVVPRDKNGKPMLPLNVGIMTVIRLGEVCMREHFHTERYIFPVGYEVTRRYLSTVDPNAEVVYHCTILDGGDGPKFQIVPSDAPERTIIAGTATGAWSSIVKQANAIRNRQHSNSVSGPDFFGLGQNTIKHLIQELPNADRLRDYVWQNFNEGGPLGGRHAAVTPALPEDYDSTLPIGVLYPTDRERRDTIPGPRGLHYYPQHIIAQAETQREPQEVSRETKQSTSHSTPISTQLSLQDPNHPHLPNPPSNPLTSPSSSASTTIASIMSAYPAPAPS